MENKQLKTFGASIMENTRESGNKNRAGQNLQKRPSGTYMRMRWQIGKLQKKMGEAYSDGDTRLNGCSQLKRVTNYLKYPLCASGATSP